MLRLTKPHVIQTARGQGGQFDPKQSLQSRTGARGIEPALLGLQLLLQLFPPPFMPMMQVWIPQQIITAVP